jgi:type IV secretion system protein VirB4
MLDLKLYRDKAKGVADLLNWAALCDAGMVQTKSGALLAGYYFRGPDTASSTPEERNHITARVNAALARMGDGWASWTDCVRVESMMYSKREASHFPDEISRLVDEERRVNFTSQDRHFESEFAFILMYTPPMRRNSKVADAIYDDETVDRAADPGPRIKEQFERALSDLEDSLLGTVGLQRMTSYTKAEQGFGGESVEVLYDELVNYLNYTLTGYTEEVRIPPIPMYMDSYMGGLELWTGDTPRYGDNFVCTVSIEGFPEATHPNILAFMDSMAMPYRWSTRFIYLDQHTALKELNKYRRKWRQKMRGFFSQIFRIQSGQVNQDAALMAAQADVAITDAQQAVVTFGYYTSVVVMMDPDREILEERARNVVRELRRMGFNGRVETVNTMQAWLGSLPGHPDPNIRRPLLHTLNLADMLPLSSVWPGRLENPCPFFPAGSPPLLHAATTGATPFRLNLHVGDLGHTLIFGPPGAGKSTLLALLLLQFRRYFGATVVGFDNGRSLFASAKAVGGQFYDLGGDTGGLGFAPLQYLDTDGDVAWAAEFINTLFELQAGHPPSPRQKQEIGRAVKLMQYSAEDRTLTAFNITVQDDEVRQAVGYYTIDGQVGHLLDARTDTLSDSDCMVFEIGELMSLGEKNLIPVLLYLFRRIDKMSRGQPGLLLLDEAWVMLGHDVFRAKLRSWLKQKRKENWCVVPATQSLSDAAHSGILDVLLEACPTKILLPNEEAEKFGTKDNPGPGDLYRMFGLNDTEISIIRNGTKKRDYYVTSTEGRRLVDLSFGPVTLAFAGVSDKPSIAKIQELETIHGPAWPYHWLDEKKVKYAHLQKR